MDRSTSEAMNEACEFLIREASGGWIVQYLEGWIRDEEGACATSREAVFTDEDTLSAWLCQRFKALKAFRNAASMDEPEGFETYMNASIK